MAYSKRGLLIVNLGTPDGPDTASVRRYLREFLSDPRVIDLNPVGRWFLLNLIILPFRPAKSAHAYQQIWTEQGSPLLVHGRALTAAVAEALKGEFEVELGMRYGHPSIAEAVSALRSRGVTELVVLSLYPQYAASTVATTNDEVTRVLASTWDFEPVRIIPPFYEDEGFLSAFVEVAREKLASAGADHVLFSFHGIPERLIHKSDPSGSHCLSSPTCCDAIGPTNHRCYRAQCYATARALASRLGIPADGWSLSFQSRLGKDPWIQPYTDLHLAELAKKGVKRVAMIVPSFAADCLETLEELAIRGRATFKDAGGEELILVPSLNAHPAWVKAVVDLVRRQG